MYFAVLGKNKELSLKELEYTSPINLHFLSNQKIVQFDSADEDKLVNVAGIVKWGKIIQQDLSDFFHDLDKKILGVADKQQGITLKKKYGLKRFKQVDLFHTDLEIKNKGVELVKVGTQWGEVLGYQNIKLYEVVDFQKPGRSMQMGMMPAKLTHSLINIGLTITGENPLIYDPFVGSGTTGFLANYYGYDFIGTDLKLTFAEKNIPWWMNTGLQTDGKQFDFFVHDATKEFTSEEKEKFGGRVPLIITEGRLGPIIKMNTTAEQVKEYQRWVKNVYLPWVGEMAISFEKKPVMVFTIPWYLGYENLLEQQLIEKSEEVGFQYNSLQEMYKRDQHKVARKIVILK